MNEFLQLFTYAYYLFGSIAITFFAMKFAFEQMRSNSGLLAIVSRVLGFVVMFLVLMLVLPSLFEFGVNNAMGRMQSSTISKNVISLTKDTAELLTQQNSQIQPVTIEDRTFSEVAEDTYNELQSQAGVQSSAPQAPQAPQSNSNQTVQTSKPVVTQSNAQTVPASRDNVAAHPFVAAPAARQAPAVNIQQHPFVAAPQPTSVPLMLMEAADPTPDGGGPQAIDADRALVMATETTYTVQRGDALWKIAERFYNDRNKAPAICNANRNVIRNCDNLRVGMVLTIPAE